MQENPSKVEPKGTAQLNAAESSMFVKLQIQTEFDLIISTEATVNTALPAMVGKLPPLKRKE